MDDNKIVALYWERSETAIAETEKKYGRYCRYIARNILYSDQDAEECVNDAYRKAWDTIPPKKPEQLSTYLGKLTRNIAINRYIHDHADKRSAGMQVIFDEAAEFIPDPSSVGAVADEIHMRNAINSFVKSLPQDVRAVFVRRYWYMSPVNDIAKDYGMTESNVKVTLMRTRNKFRDYLEKEGIVL